MRRRSIYPARRIDTPSQLGGARMAAIQAACEFDLDAASLDWAMWTVLKHETHLRGWRLDGRQAELGLTYSLEEDTRFGSKWQLVCRAHGHDFNPRATSYTYAQRNGRDIADFAEGERQWLEAVANWHSQTQGVIDAGGDPRLPDAAHIMADPCLARLVRHHGIDLHDFLTTIPRFGRFIVGRGWYRTDPMPRILEIGEIRVHAERTAARISVGRIGLGQGVSYSPPEPARSRRVGILYTPKVQLSETLRDALIGKPLSQMVAHPALDAGLRIRAISKSGSGVAVRVEGCDHIRPMTGIDGDETS